MSPAPSDSVSQANSLHRGDSVHTRRKDSSASYSTMALKTSQSRQLTPQAATRPIFNQSSQEISDDEEDFASNEQSTPAHTAADSAAKISKEEEERLKAEVEEEERKKKLQLYVFVAKCIAYHFNAKQPTDMARRQLKVTRQELSRIKERFQAFLKGETQIAADEAFTKAIESYYEV
ncbi:unnamed protein product [Gongylonema pulchrum]|uniref:Calcium-transporting ATPase n=1 Tax=Gongylonema pulchrum TaxID=637853 RepID=A0A183E7X0_9BILA|nr:unnamed protein product [Gongylonema pulchrum]